MLVSHETMNSYDSMMYCYNTFFMEPPQFEFININDLKLYQHYLSQQNTDALKAFDEPNSFIGTINFNNYKKIIEDKQLDIVTDIILQGSSVDTNIFAVAAVHAESYTVLQLLSDTGFSFRQRISNIDAGGFIFKTDSTATTFDILGHAIRLNKLDVCKFLIERGAHPGANDNFSLVCQFGDANLLTYILEMYQNIPLQFITCNIVYCTTSTEKLKLLLQYGANIADVPCSVISKIINEANPETLQLLIDSGLELTPEKCTTVWSTSNFPIMTFLLERGIQPDTETIKLIFYSGNYTHIRMLAECDVDLSNIKIDDGRAIQLLDKFENRGMDAKTVAYLMINRFMGDKLFMRTRDVSRK